MAILQDFEVMVFVGDVQANEYEDDDEKPTALNEIVKYIEAVSGAQFTFRLRVDETFRFEKADAIAAYLYVDGEYSGGDVIPRSEVTGSGYEQTVTGMYAVEGRGRRS